MSPPKPVRNHRPRDHFPNSSEPSTARSRTLPLIKTSLLINVVRWAQFPVRPARTTLVLSPRARHWTAPNRILISFTILFLDPNAQHHKLLCSRRISVRISHFIQRIHINILSVRTYHLLLQHIHINISSVRTSHLLPKHISTGHVVSQNISLITKTYKHRTHCQSGPTTCYYNIYTSNILPARTYHLLTYQHTTHCPSEILLVIKINSRINYVILNHLQLYSLCSITLI